MSRKPLPPEVREALRDEGPEAIERLIQLAKDPSLLADPKPLPMAPRPKKKP